MIRHVVLVRLRPDLPSAEVDAVFAGLAALRKHLPGMKAFAHGPNVSPEGLARGATYVFTVDFEDAAARRCLSRLAGARGGGRSARPRPERRGAWAGLTVVDFDLP